MNAMRRSTVALAVLPLLAIVGCGGGGDSGNGGDDATAASACPVAALEAASGPVKITFWQGGLRAELMEALDDLVEAYNGTQDVVQVDLHFQGTYDEAADKYLTALRGGTVPDVVLLEETRLQQMVDSGSIVPAQACVDAADYDLSDHLPVVLDEFRVAGDLGPMPFNLSNLVLYYDKADFRTAGLDPEDPPATFAEVLEAARAIKERGAAGTGFAWQMRPWQVEQWYAKAGATIVDQGNGRDGRAEAATFDTAAGREVYGFVRELFDEGLAVNVGRNEGGADALLAVGKGDAAMTIETSAALGSIYAIQEAGQFADVELGVAPIPGPTAADGGVQPAGGSLWIVGKGKSDRTIAASWDFVRWLNEPAQQATWAARTGYIPVRRSAVELPAMVEQWRERPTYRVAYDQLAASKAPGGPAIGPYREVRDAETEALEALILRGVSVADALGIAQRGADDALRSYNERVGG
jgi:sn-glycerol 3-phosphate transport system substrate-binding protein